MTNEEKFKTSVERARQFKIFCESQKHGCNECELTDCALDECRYAWLTLKYKEPPRDMEDIIKELRELSSVSPMPGALAIGDCISTIYGKPIRWYLGDIANEIEAAWEREAKAIATENAVLPAVCITKPAGNAAKMHEALIGIRKELARMVKIYNTPLDGIESYVSDGLSVSPRNCDLYNTLEEARSAFLENYEPDSTNYSAIKFIFWLFNEAEGGANG